MKTDIDLKRDVEDELEWEPTVDPAAIGVAVKDGAVTLTGTVRYYGEKWAAERAVKRVAGVKAVAEEIKVKPSESDQRTDSDIAQATAQALKWRIWVPSQVKARVEDGWLTLEGEVKRQCERNAAEDAVRYLPGVRGVSNLISVKPKVTAEDVKTGIKKALERHAELDTDAIHVEAIGGKVILRGKVNSWAERDEAVSAAWSAPGVVSVEDHMTFGF
ncbi:MAG TPA: BON domain-containing protein [Thermoanaerobaculaceae bacterium]|nr:BON domain-containing protein [Thermoanaerobaculaceae bacterium]